MFASKTSATPESGFGRFGLGRLRWAPGPQGFEHVRATSNATVQENGDLKKLGAPSSFWLLVARMFLIAMPGAPFVECQTKIQLQTTSEHHVLGHTRTKRNSRHIQEFASCEQTNT